MATLSLTHVQSLPNFVGSFVAGTCAGVGAMTYMLVGMVRTDTGLMTAMYVTPTSNSIVNSAGLVNAMAQEYLQPDSFLGGGLQLAGEAGASAYLLCANALYQSVRYAVRYEINPSLRRMLTVDVSTKSSTVQSLVILDSIVYVLVNWNTSVRSYVSVLKSTMASGEILEQVHIMSNSSNVYCADMSPAGRFLSIVCTVQLSNITIATLLSVNKQLAFSHVPVGFTRYDYEIFASVPVKFQRSKIPVSSEKTTATSTDTSFSTSEYNPTARPTVFTTNPPSAQPTVSPSTQPSSRPTVTPSVSSQPSSQPSGSGPTNTYKPTVKDTSKPTQSPTLSPTTLPTIAPTITSTRRPTVQPSRHPSTQPSMYPTAVPTRPPQSKPTAKPSLAPSLQPTHAPTSNGSSMSTLVGAKKKEKSSLVLVIGGSIFGGLLFLWGGYRLLSWYVYFLNVKEKRKAMRALLQNTPIPLSNKPKRVVTPVVKNNTPDASIRGAYAVGIPVVASAEAHNTSIYLPEQADKHVLPDMTHLCRNSTPEAGVSEGIGDANEITNLEAVGGDELDSDSSVFLSSLHTSERSDADFHLPPTTALRSTGPMSPPIFDRRSKECAMEEGSVCSSIFSSDDGSLTSSSESDDDE